MYFRWATFLIILVIFPLFCPNLASFCSIESKWYRVCIFWICSTYCTACSVLGAASRLAGTRRGNNLLEFSSIPENPVGWHLLPSPFFSPWIDQWFWSIVPRASPLPFPWSERGEGSRGREEERPWKRGCLIDWLIDWPDEWLTRGLMNWNSM